MYDYLIPPKTLGDCFRNLQLHQGFQQTQLAKVLGIARFTVQRYEANRATPSRAIQPRLKQQFGFQRLSDRCKTN